MGELLKNLKGKTRGSIVGIRKRLKRHDYDLEKCLDGDMNADIRRWSREEEQYLIDNYASSTILEMAKELGRTRNSVNSKIETLYKQDKLDRKVKKLTDYEINFIKNHAGLCRPAEIANAIGRSSAVVNKYINTLKSEGKL